jgi:hypothetical protein
MSEIEPPPTPTVPPPPSPLASAAIDIGKALVIAVIDEVIKPSLREWRERRKQKKEHGHGR